MQAVSWWEHRPLGWLPLGWGTETSLLPAWGSKRSQCWVVSDSWLELSPADFASSWCYSQPFTGGSCSHRRAPRTCLYFFWHSWAKQLSSDCARWQPETASGHYIMLFWQAVEQYLILYPKCASSRSQNLWPQIILPSYSQGWLSSEFPGPS